MDGQKNEGPEAILERPVEHGAGDMANICARAFEQAMGLSASLSSARVIASARPVASAYQPGHLGHVTIERATQRECQRRTVKIRVFPNEKSPERLASAVPGEIDECRERDQHKSKSEFPDSRLRNLYS